MISASQIRPNTPVVCSDNRQLAVVDHMEGAETIKLTKDDKGLHHYIPMSWVKSVDDKVHLDRPGDQVTRDWSTKPKMTNAVGTGDLPKAPDEKSTKPNMMTNAVGTGELPKARALKDE
jgi:hypothetical protein